MPFNRQGYTYINWWSRLFFSHSGKDLWLPSAPIWVSCTFAALAAPYQVYHSIYYDPEVRLRPQKKAWHQDPEKIARASTYRGSFARIVLRQRMAYKDMHENNGFEHREPGQIGFEEAPIPKLD